ncbi:hypothetical protein ACHAPJ_011274 [Fusarium lateritium]
MSELYFSQMIDPLLIGFPQLPKDIAAVESGGKNYVFYVSDHQLCYLVSSGGQQNGSYEQHVVEVKGMDLKVKCGERQIAATAWKRTSGEEIRVYCIVPEDSKCAKRGYIQEVCFSNNNGSEQGLLGAEEPRPYVSPSSSLSATVRVFPDKADIKLFASGKDEKGNNKISVHSYSYAKENWFEKLISDKVSTW